MYCSFCGKEIKNEANFCSWCGRNLSTKSPKTDNVKKKSIKKFFTLRLAGVVAVILLIVFINSVSSPSIEGVWMDGTNKVTFTGDGDFRIDGTYGTYTIDDDNTLIMTSGEYSYWSGEWKYEYGPEAKEKYDYWYISGGTLYFRGGEYTKK